MCSNTSTDLSCYLHLHREQLLLITEILIMMITLVHDARSWSMRPNEALMREATRNVIAKFRLNHQSNRPSSGPESRHDHTRTPSLASGVYGGQIGTAKGQFRGQRVRKVIEDPGGTAAAWDWVVAPVLTTALLL